MPTTIKNSPAILVVDDEPAVRELMRRLLAKAGYSVRTAADGDEAWSLLKQGDDTISLVVTDVAMPHMSGPELAHRAATLRSAPRVLFVSTTASGELDGVAPLLPKPFDANQLLACVERLLAGG